MLSFLYIGIDLELKCDPVPNSPSQYSLENEIEHAAWLKQINRLKHIGSVRRLEPEELSTAFFAPMFVVPKKDSPEFGCIYNMRYLNKYIKYKHFKLKGLPVVRDLLRRNDFMTKVDLQDAYLHCAIKQAHQRYLAFVDDNEEFWCFLVLPFGLTSAPRWFTKIMKEVMGFFRRCGIRLTIYFDDIVIFTEVVNGDFEAARTKARETHEYVVQVLRKLGWLISEKKNFPEPTHVLEILGLTINSHTMTISAPPKKVKKLKQKALKLLRTGESIPRELASFLGYLNSLSQALLPERLRTRALHMDKNKALKSNGRGSMGVLPRTKNSTSIRAYSRGAEQRGRSALKISRAQNRVGPAFSNICPVLVVKMPLKLIGTEVVVPPTGMTVTEAESKLAKWNLFAW